MNFNEYQRLANVTAKDMGGPAENLVHAALGMAGELAELLYPNSYDNAREEAGDLMWYVALATTALGEDLGNVIDFWLPNAQTTASSEDLDRVVSAQSDDEDNLIQAVGEFVDLSKKVWVYGKPLDTGMRNDMLDQIGAIVVYLTGYIDGEWDMALTPVLDENIAKLKKRYGDKYSDDAAITRADKA